MTCVRLPEARVVPGATPMGNLGNQPEEATETQPKKCSTKWRRATRVGDEPFLGPRSVASRREPGAEAFKAPGRLAVRWYPQGLVQASARAAMAVGASGTADFPRQGGPLSSMRFCFECAREVIFVEQVRTRTRLSGCMAEPCGRDLSGLGAP